MTDVIVQQKGTLTVYACGGTGINIGKQIRAEESIDNEFFARITVGLIDTSRSNLHGAAANNFFLIKTANQSALDASDELDGSGQKRNENPEHIKAAIPDILLTFTPGDINIVIHSGAGGSGSVAGPLITAELKRRGKNVIALVVGSRDTGKDIENTINTIRSYIGISTNASSPIPVYYEENGSEKDGVTLSRLDVDRLMLVAINSIAALYSRRNGELDLRDLDHWINFNKVIDEEPRMVGLHILDKEQAVKFEGGFTSVASLQTVNSGSVIGPDIIPAYQVRGIVPENLINESQGGGSKLPLHYVLTDTVITERIATLIRLEASLKEKAKAHKPKMSIMSNDKKIDDDGLVF